MSWKKDTLKRVRPVFVRIPQENRISWMHTHVCIYFRELVCVVKEAGGSEIRRTCWTAVYSATILLQETFLYTLKALT